MYFCQIAQVHRATLVDGREVVVKIQHDGIKDIILEVCLYSEKTDLCKMCRIAISFS
jgi:hypothetical protein